MNPNILFTVLDGLTFLGGGLLLSVWLTNRSKTLRLWSLAYFVAGFGMAFVLWGVLLSPWLSYGLGSGLVLAAYGIMSMSLRAISNKAKSSWWLLLPGPFWWAASPIPPLQGSEILRMIAFSPLAAACMVGVAWSVAFIPGRPAARLPLIGTSIFHGAFYILRTVALALDQGPATHSFWLYATAIEGIAFIFCDAFLVMSLVRSHREQELVVEAQTDFLTGVLNRRGFTAMAEARMRKTSCSLLLMDIDHFKLFNDKLGHAAGDDLLRQLARACIQHVGANGLAEDWGAMNSWS